MKQVEVYYLSRVYSDINLHFLRIFKGETIRERKPEEKTPQQGSWAKKGEARPFSSALSFKPN